MDIVDGRASHGTRKSSIRTISEKFFPSTSPDPGVDWLVHDSASHILNAEKGKSDATMTPRERVWLEDTDKEVLNQLLVSTEGTDLCLHDPWTESTRRVRRDIKSEIDQDHEYFCILDVLSPKFPGLKKWILMCGRAVRTLHVNDLYRVPHSHSLAPQNGLLPRHPNLRPRPRIWIPAFPFTAADYTATAR